MELKELEELVEDMVLQLSYPGLDTRSLNIALPMAANDAPVKLYVLALNSKSINVKLIALRWFQNRPGAAKHHIKPLIGLLEDKDSWIRKEAIKTIEITKSTDSAVILKICALLKDEDQIVRIAAAKSLGNLVKENPRVSELNKEKKSPGVSTLKETIINSLNEATDDPIQEVRRKAIKALRKIGAFSAS
jgi:hypothetical protein